MITTLTGNHKILKSDPELSKCNSFNGELWVNFFMIPKQPEQSHMWILHASSTKPPQKQLKNVRLGFRVIALKRCNQLINLWSKVVYLFVWYRWDPQNQDASDHVLDLFRKLSRRRGASAWFHGIWTSGVEVLEYWKNFSLKIKLNPSWNFGKNWNVALVLLGRSLDEQDLKEFIW